MPLCVPSPTAPGKGCADHVQLGLRVLLGSVHGDPELCSGLLEEVQHSQLDLPQQQGLLEGCALDVGPAGLLGDRVSPWPLPCVLLHPPGQARGTQESWLCIPLRQSCCFLGMWVSAQPRRLQPNLAPPPTALGISLV